MGRFNSWRNRFRSWIEIRKKRKMDNTPKIPDIVITMLHKYIPILVGAFITLMTNNFGIDLSQFSQQYQEAIFVLLSLVAMTVWYIIWRAGSKYYPWLAWLLGWPALPERYVTAKAHAEQRKLNAKVF